MAVQMSELLSEFRQLMKFINCEMILDMTDENLHSILFVSQTRKNAFLTWLIQQIYSPGISSSNSLDALTSIFIPHKYLQNFLTVCRTIIKFPYNSLRNIMPLVEQQKRWKLIMEALFRKRNQFNQNYDYITEIETGALREKYEYFWNKKTDFKLPQIVCGKLKSYEKCDLQTQIQTSKSQLQCYSQLSDDNSSLNMLTENKTICETAKNYQKSWFLFNEDLSQINAVHSDLKDGKVALNKFTYDILDKELLISAKINLKLLKQDMDTFDQIINTVENATYSKNNNNEYV